VPLARGSTETIPIYYELSRAPESMGDILFFHGGPAFPRETLGDSELLWAVLRAHFNVLYFHQRGSGHSARIERSEEIEGRRGQYTLDAVVDDATVLWKELLSGRPVVAMGKSAGGFLALKFALAHPDGVAALVLAATAADHRYISERRRVKAEFLSSVAQRHPGFAPAYAAALGMVGDKADPAYAGPIALLLSEETLESVLFDLSYTLSGQFEMVGLVRDLEAGRYDLLMTRLSRGQQTLRLSGMESLIVLNSISCRELGFGRDNPEACEGIQETDLYDVSARLGEVTARTLVLSGRHDPVLPPSFQEVIARGVSGPVVWKVLELSGHMIFQEQPNASAAAVLEFLRIPAQQPAQTPAL